MRSAATLVGCGLGLVALHALVLASIIWKKILQMLERDAVRFRGWVRVHQSQVSFPEATCNTAH